MPYVKLSDVNLYYEEMGVGEPLIFLHSSFSRGIISFSAQLMEFQNDYHCLFPDFRCHGRSRANQLDWDMPQIADDIVKLMDHLEIDRAKFVGFSMGGVIAFYLAIKYPERVKSFISIGAAAQINEALLEKADNLEPEALITNNKLKFIESVKANHKEAHNGDWMKFVKTTIDNWRTYPKFTDYEFASIAAPCLLIVGQNDETVLESDIERLKVHIKNIEVRVVEGCGHGPHYVFEQPVLVNNLMKTFLHTNNG